MCSIWPLVKSDRGKAPASACPQRSSFPISYRALPFLSTLLAVFCATEMAAQAAPKPPPAKVPADHAQQMTKGLELFKQDVRLLLNEHCVKCHGGEKTKGEFDLTTREGLLHGGAEGPAVVVGNARTSKFYKMVAHTVEPFMPHKADKLPDAAVAKIAAWIDAGAPYDKPLLEKKQSPKGRATVGDEDRKFWSLQPLKHEEPPRVKNKTWGRTPVDAFVLAKLEAVKLSPNPAADRRKLIRRAYFDLIGLPPTPEEVEAFVADTALDAYEKLIDHLLASPHYGERWGRHWLDLARFAESHGFEQDYDRPSAYHYRDFVIQALNQDMPYHQFVKWQIAGDELAPENLQAMMATGYLAAGVHATQITANQAEKERYDELDDVAATIGTSLLGLTVGCARCHDHKYDPIPSKDYYRLISTFTTTVRSDVDLDLHPEQYREAKAKFDQDHVPLVAALERFETEQLPGRFEQWLRTGVQPPQPKWLALDWESAKSQGGATLTKQSDGSLLASGTNPDFDAYTFIARTPLKNISAVKLEALAHPSFAKGGPGRAGNGNFDLTDFRVTAAPADGKGPAVEVKLTNPKATFEQASLPIAAAIDGDQKSGWAVDPQFGKDHAAVFECAPLVGFDGGTVLTFTLKFDGNNGHNIGRPRVSISTAPLPASLEGEPGAHDLMVELSRAWAVPTEQRTPAQKAVLLKWYRTSDAEWQKLNLVVQEHLKKTPQPELTKVLVSSEGLPAIRLNTQGPDFYEKTFLLKRGDLNQKQEEAAPGFLQALMRTPEQEKHWQVPPPKGWRTSYRRTSLANWITDTDQGAGNLLARVIVNRLWQHHFGRGIVGTPSDFGAQGERPTHPELLDWLANELIRQGWRLKPLHKLIMMSAVYAEGSEFKTAAAKTDPDDKLFWRRSPHRLEGEIIRDAVLAVSGTLDPKMFGPGTLDEGNHRRSIYFTIKRSQLVPMMALFDAPEPNQSSGSRSTTTVAPQALMVMNNPQMRNAAKAFAKRLGESKSDPNAVIAKAYHAALGRPPFKEELMDGIDFLARQGAAYRASGKPDVPELALADFCQALLGLNEFIYID